MNNKQGLQQCRTETGTWTHLTVDGLHPVCNSKQEATEVADIVLDEKQIASIHQYGATLITTCRRCDKWSKSYVRRSTFTDLANATEEVAQ